MKYYLKRHLPIGEGDVLFFLHSHLLVTIISITHLLENDRNGPDYYFLNHTFFFQ